MNEFKNLDKREIYEVESDILKNWKGVQGIYKKTLEVHKKDPKFVFYDGPAFANGHPGLHHMIAKNLKDIICKYHTMKGHYVLRKVGWDTHGLPIENHVEKKLNLHNKKEIEAFGIENFNNECRKSVRENEDTFTDLTNKMGQFIDVENPYLTYKNEYIETEWWILKKYFEEGLFYEGNRVTPYCPRCGTGLATHEVAQGYEDMAVDTVYVPMKIKRRENTYFLVWTTTPWTLLANIALCVNPDVEYSEVLVGENHFILASALVSTLFEDANIVKTYLGKDLEYIEYEQLIPILKPDKKAFFVTCADYVTTEDGTGVVHIAPAYGADDFEVAKKYDLPILNPVGKDGCYTEGPWEGMLVFDADKEVISYLKENDKLFKKQRMTHNYPHCWRCHSPLLYYTLPSYYIAVTKYKDKIIEANKKVNWYPAYVGEKRFGNWLENLKDWAVSRSRYWGTPIPYWTCDCGHTHMIGSIKELKELATTEIKEEELDLHRPYIDEIKITCPKCGKEMERIKDVLDCWFDSGSMPFAQYHYPFENEELFESQFPADFICEGIDQTRGWFYTLLVISTFVKGVSPYKNVLVNDLLLDAEGKKMSKSRGNIVEPFTTMKKYGADTVRFYLPYVSPVWTPLKFNEEGLKEVYSKFFNPLRNTYNFFAMYASTDKIDIEKCNVSYKEREEIDLWLLSKYHNLLKYVTESFEEYDLFKVVRAITNFVSEDLSNWYIRRNRNRFWGSELNNSKKSVYMTTYGILVGLAKMTAPIIPFLSEELYQNLTKEESVHLTSYPEYDETLINNDLEEKMDTVRELISIGRNVREEVKIKVREPLSECLLDGRLESLIGNLKDLILEELNVKEVVFVEDLSKYMNFQVKPNFKIAGPIFGADVKLFATYLSNISPEELNKVNNHEKITIIINEKEYVIDETYLDIRISAKEGYNAGMGNNLFVILNTHRSEELILEGIAREFISKVQNIRKTEDYNVIDRIIISYNGDDDIKESVEMFMDYIKSETLATEIIYDETVNNPLDLNGHRANIATKKV